MTFTLEPAALGSVSLLPGLFLERFDLNRRYLTSLSTDNLVQHHLFEAGLWGPPERVEDIFWGWESPNSQVRSHFVGHWLSAASRVAKVAPDPVLEARVHEVVGELGRCQQANGGEWVFGIPEKYLHWIAAGRPIWAPHYIVQKTLTGLLDAHRIAGDEQALDLVINAARWFERWTGAMSQDELDELFDFETGAMLELWSDLFAITKDERHLDLLNRYYRRRLFDPLLAGDDILTNQHANMTIPEAQGAARAWEVTGEQRWRDIVDAYWRCAVVDRDSFCTGGQTSAEVWAPPGELSARLGASTQEHCTVYNMNRLASYLFRWTGDAAYADYREQNIYNGILAQQHRETGMVTYYLPLHAGARKTWSTPKQSFWCCVATLVQAQASHADDVYFTDDDGVVIAQYVPSAFAWEGSRGPIVVSQTLESRPGDPGKADYRSPRPVRRPDAQILELSVDCETPTEFDLGLRLPGWLAGAPVIAIDGEVSELPMAPGSIHRLRRKWHHQRIRLELPRKVVTRPLPDAPDTVAFMDGPVVLAGLCDRERQLIGDRGDASTMLRP
ncbi:MAG: glycoside hydrolase family 127 protein, partial [Actinobacteria bacterium]|nr:glycoside hydrolase family 127 protein [Actinomycetota bacterium]